MYLLLPVLAVDEATDAFVRPVSAAPPDVELSPKEQVRVGRYRGLLHTQTQTGTCILPCRFAPDTGCALACLPCRLR